MRSNKGGQGGEARRGAEIGKREENEGDTPRMKSEVIPWKIKIASGKFSNIFSHYANGESLAPSTAARLGTG